MGRAGSRNPSKEGCSGPWDREGGGTDPAVGLASGPGGHGAMSPEQALEVVDVAVDVSWRIRAVKEERAIEAQA